ncbi:MAG: restriction endonuclease subunit S, partial [Planktothrix sp.]
MGKNLKKKVPELRFPEFDGDWSIKTLGDISDIKGGKRIPLGYSLVDQDNGFPYITVSDIQGTSVCLDKIKFVPIEVINSIKNYKITINDIFISVAGTLGLVGIIPKSLNNANLTE